ncbi:MULTISPECIES: zincin-like metallopeptidase domain-containing protein [unclassified Alteromonas]|uniref:zincin-like metallopeptidase domain-containing protein n=1 Tax=unclassified Alteromonas TaxID=2614992 RepID=UPI001653AB3F|nr:MULTISPECIES: zincin-like metallopeptidase domain-containing protein [unclassified Alteromonas]MBC6987550.1 DUF1738 domain-containing protein [Alteromonas sp. BZK5]MCG7643361.1 zincin-like metallopeptidase domain-containing protein [Alteromonas sp. MmMcT2-2]MCG7649623.1 zincin-like metallopeptidase domain-containing protein [Alteromonas sp. MmMcT2-5]
MFNLATFRNSVFLQHEYALATGRSIVNLMTRSRDIHGKTNFSNFLIQTQSTSSPIKWLEYEESLDASVKPLKQAATFLSELEALAGATISELLEGLKRKHSGTTLRKIFGLESEEWADVTKSELLPLLKEFDFWIRYLDELGVSEQLTSAYDVQTLLNMPLFSSVKRLADVIDLNSAGWEHDQKIFDNLVGRLDKENSNFVSEWLTSPVLEAHYNAHTHRQYDSLFSWLFLSLISEHHGFKSNFWATKKQWEKMGCELSVDAKPAAVFHHFTIKAKEDAVQLAEDEVTSGFGRKVSIVYNASQVIGFDGADAVDVKVKPLSKLDEIIKALNVRIEHTIEGKAFYDPNDDYITMPQKEMFKGKDATKAYYGTLIHEMVHWTGHESRCNREIGHEFGSAKYAFEELVAELGSCFLCTRFGIRKLPGVNSVRYINSWLSSLNVKDTMKKLESAARKANQASNYIYIPQRDD